MCMSLKNKSSALTSDQLSLLFSPLDHHSASFQNWSMALSLTSFNVLPIHSVSWIPCYHFSPFPSLLFLFKFSELIWIACKDRTDSIQCFHSNSPTTVLPTLSPNTSWAGCELLRTLLQDSELPFLSLSWRRCQISLLQVNFPLMIWDQPS